MSHDHYSPEILASLAAVEQRISYRFKDITLLATALTHSSWANEHGLQHNERLEYLGDAVLELNISHEIYLRYPEQREGAMTRMRSRLVSEERLAEIAHDLDLGASLLMGKGEEAQGGRQRAALLADAVEALLGAVYLDGGHDEARAVVARLYETIWPSCLLPDKEKDYKTKLQEATQALLGTLPVYVQLDSRGPAHAKEFSIRLELSNGQQFLASGGSIKKAEQAAARMALDGLQAGTAAEPAFHGHPCTRTHFTS